MPPDGGRRPAGNLRNVSVDRRLLTVSLGAALVISVAGGYALSRGDGVSRSDDDVVLDTPGEVQIPTIGTNTAVQGTPLPVADLEDNDGTVISSAELTGGPLVINIWNSTCGACKKELPAFAAVHADLGDDIRFVGVNTQDSAKVNESFARQRGVKYELLRDIADGFSSAVGIVILPVTLFVDADGVIIRQTGVLDEEALREYAAELLG